jgi:hypothetical protein
MARFSLDGYRRQWPRVGGMLAMALGGVTALSAVNSGAQDQDPAGNAGEA